MMGYIKTPMFSLYVKITDVLLGASTVSFIVMVIMAIDKTSSNPAGTAFCDPKNKLTVMPDEDKAVSVSQ